MFINLKRTAAKNLMSTDVIKIMWMPWIVFYNLEHENESKKTEREDIEKIIPNPGFKFVTSGETNFQNTRIFEGSENAVYFEREFSINWLCDYNMKWYHI